MRYKYLHKIDRLKSKLYIFWLYSRPWHRITAIAENHGTRRKSR